MTTTPAVGWVTSGFGKRKPPKKADGTYGTAYHRGVDIGGPPRTPVVAPEAGTVTHIARTSARGLYVIVDHGRYRTLHQHLDEVTVYQGQHVTEGQQIGVMGTTGGVARHLHTEVHDGTTPIDPAPWYAARGVTLGAAPVRVAGVSTTAPSEEDTMLVVIAPGQPGALIYPSGEWTLVHTAEDATALAAAGAKTAHVSAATYAGLVPAAKRLGATPAPAASVDVVKLAAALVGPLAAELRRAGVTTA